MHGRHEADGRGVTAHVVECLRDDFSSDCEVVHFGRTNGFRRIWTEKFGRPLVHLDDRDRGGGGGVQSYMAAWA